MIDITCQIQAVVAEAESQLVHEAQQEAVVSSPTHKSPDVSAEKDSSHDSSLRIVKVIEAIQVPETEGESSMKHTLVPKESLEDEHHHLLMMIAKLQDENEKLILKN